MAIRDANGRFIKGESGNPGGRVRDILSRSARKRVSEEDSDRLADVLVTMALDGNLKALELLWDRFEGKAMQPQHLTGEVTTQIREIIIRQPPPPEAVKDAP